MEKGLEKKLLNFYLVFDTSTLSYLEKLKLLSKFLPKVKIKVGITKEVQDEIRLKRIKNLIDKDIIKILKPKNGAYYTMEIRRIQRVLGTRKNLGEISSYVFVKLHEQSILISEDSLILELQKRFDSIRSSGFLLFLYLLYKSRLLSFQKVKIKYNEILSKLGFDSRAITFNLASLREIDPKFVEKLLEKL